MALFSIVTVCLNDLEGLKTTAKSIKEQDFKDYEWIVIDGGSQDGTSDYLKVEDAIDVYTSENDDGIYDAMNKGIKHATGEYCLFLNAGDYFCGENVLTTVSGHRGSDLLVGGIIVFDPVLETYEVKRFNSLEVGYNSLYFRTLPHQSSFFKTTLFERFGLYDTSYRVLADHDFFARIFNQVIQVEFLNINIAVFVKDGISSSFKGSELFKEELNKVRIHNYSSIYRFWRETLGCSKSFLRRILRSKR